MALGSHWSSWCGDMLGRERRITQPVFLQGSVAAIAGALLGLRVGFKRCVASGISPALVAIARLCATPEMPWEVPAFKATRKTSPSRGPHQRFQCHRFKVNQHPVADVMPVLLKSGQSASREEVVEEMKNCRSMKQHWCRSTVMPEYGLSIFYGRLKPRSNHILPEYSCMT
ncbi:hypothetical protein DY000_02016148 [Brassica cretica]|uniref:Uncharacterized protein n=1 Tax=Brassica cretica TaxID=69181 RepID=A0ABQ7D0E0_BRACR|nr:hypothetical protein DY000_02016148 [Brassica cretica]